jgi:hypothetical protein
MKGYANPGLPAEKLCLAFLPGQAPRPPAPGEASRRIYAGAEFCERLLPSPADLRDLLALARKENLKLTLLTPYVTDAGLARLEPLFGLLAANPEAEPEVTVNDLGVLRLLGKYPGPARLFGRTLVSHYLRGGEFPGDVLELAAAHKVKAFEFNSARHLLRAGQALRGAGFGAHLYSPFMYLSTTRFCRIPAAGGKYYRDSLAGCGRECGGVYGRMEHKDFPAGLAVWGNAVFARDVSAQEPPAQADRVVLFDFEGAL